MYGSESSASTNGPAARTGFHGLPRSSRARINAKRFVFNAPQRPCSRLAAERSEQENVSRTPQHNFEQRVKQEAAGENTRINGRGNCYEMSLLNCEQ